MPTKQNKEFAISHQQTGIQSFLSRAPSLLMFTWEDHNWIFLSSSSFPICCCWAPPHLVWDMPVVSGASSTSCVPSWFLPTRSIHTGRAIWGPGKILILYKICSATAKTSLHNPHCFQHTTQHHTNYFEKINSILLLYPSQDQYMLWWSAQTGDSISRASLATSTKFQFEICPSGKTPSTTDSLESLQFAPANSELLC